MKASFARFTLQGQTPMSQSRFNDAPKLEGETANDHDQRTWRNKMHVGENGTVIIPPHGLHQALIKAATLTGMQIPGKGKATYTKFFMNGLHIDQEIDTGIDPQTVQPVTIMCSTTGTRGVGKRVPRVFPQITTWQADVTCWIIAHEITQAVFEKHLKVAGIFVGLGRFRPEVGGWNGRFQYTRLDWEDNRQMVS